MYFKIGQKVKLARLLTGYKDWGTIRSIRFVDGQTIYGIAVPPINENEDSILFRFYEGEFYAFESTG